MDILGGWCGAAIVTVAFVCNEALLYSDFLLMFPFGRLCVVPLLCLAHIFCALASANRGRELLPATVSVVVLAYQFLGPPLATVLQRH